MSYKDFPYPDVAIQFGLTEGSADLFVGVQEIPASAALRSFLGMNLTLANLINTEKARSELLVAPVLSELWGRGGGRINLFSGVEFPADPAAQLTGYVDFLIGQGPQLPRVSAPVVVIFEAKRDNIAEGYGQCIAAMIGAQRFNLRAGNAVETIYGCVTTGINWKFLRLVGAQLTFDLSEYTIQQPDRLLGLLAHMAGLPPAPAVAA
ncbi:hypothetical protein [Gemmata sp.]|uniref:hypothetical protein n=1 Tax=Gemmata sp. TaxID=1914242 RepID=UPI003F7071AF